MMTRSIREILADLEEGRLTAEVLMRGCLSRINAHAERLNVFASRHDDASLIEAAASVDRRRAAGDTLGLLAGIPVGIKDIFETWDLPTTASSELLAGNRTGRDAAVVARLRQAGAIIVGKTQTHEFAYGPTTRNEYAGPSRNPWNPEHVPGGSSGGSAIALATGMCLGATGSDTGGSIRTPSALCGVSGLKPTYGLVSRARAFSLAWSLDHAGPMARSVDDLAFLLQAMAGHDPDDPGSREVPIPDYVTGIVEAPAKLSVGLPTDYYLEILHPEVQGAFEAALDRMRALGWRIEKVPLPSLRYALGAELAILSAEASAYHRERIRRHAAKISPNVRCELDAGLVILATDYLLGQRVRRLIIRDFQEAFQRVDVIATPTVPIPAPKIDQMEIEIAGKRMSALNAIWRNVFPTNLTGSPTLCFPCGFTAERLPVSLQLIGRNFDELTLLRAGHLFQSVTDWHRAEPPIKKAQEPAAD